MRINAGSKLTRADVYAAVAVALEHGQDIDVCELAVSPRGAITFYGYSLNGTRNTNRSDGNKAASWSAWGWLIAELYNRDPNARIGQYKSASSFMLQCREANERVRLAEHHGYTVRSDTGRDISFLEHLRTAQEVQS